MVLLEALRTKLCRSVDSLASMFCRGLAFTRVDVDRSECRASGIVLVARFARAGADHHSMVAYEGLLRILS